MRYQLLLISIVLLGITACQKSERPITELVPNLNGTWKLTNMQTGDFNSGVSSQKPEIWTINGNEVDIQLSPSFICTVVLGGGVHRLSIQEEVDTIYLIIDDEEFGALKLTESKLYIDTGNKPNASVSDAPRFTFMKEN